MIERYFVVRKAKDAEEVCFSISESELMWRLKEIVLADWEEDQWIDILLHGEPKERDEWEEYEKWVKDGADLIAKTHEWIRSKPRGK